MFCYNCGNDVGTATECPFCKKILPPLKPAPAEKDFKPLNAEQNDLPADDSEFVPGELSIYEKYTLKKKRTLFGLMNIVAFIIGSAADDGRELPDHWHRISTELMIHKDKLILKQSKFFWIPPTPWFKSYGRKEKTLHITDVIALERCAKNLLVLQFGGKEFRIPIHDKFQPDGLVYNLKAANPAIRFVDQTSR